MEVLIAINVLKKVTKSKLIFAYLWVRSPREGNFWIDLKKIREITIKHT
jgi:hypothetical protein